MVGKLLLVPGWQCSSPRRTGTCSVPAGPAWPLMTSGPVANRHHHHGRPIVLVLPPILVHMILCDSFGLAIPCTLVGCGGQPGMGGCEQGEHVLLSELQLVLDEAACASRATWEWLVACSQHLGRSAMIAAVPPARSETLRVYIEIYARTPRYGLSLVLSFATLVHPLVECMRAPGLSCSHAFQICTGDQLETLSEAHTKSRQQGQTIARTANRQPMKGKFLRMGSVS